MEDIYIIMSLAEVSCKKQLKLLEEFGSSKEIFSAFNNNSQKLKNILSSKEIDKISEILNGNRLEEFKKGLKALNIQCVTLEDQNYSQKLKEIYDPPTCLYAKGDVSLLNFKSIAIVGTRVCSRYGNEQTKIFAKGLTKVGFVIVSGLADGVDSVAQRACVEEGGKTIAVLAGGLNHIYPSINQDLAKQIVEKGGLLISENPPEYLPKSYNFIQRNRIIAGLSEGVFVSEAGAKSGSLHTVNFAIESGRAVFALPGPVNSSKSEGTNFLIKTLQGCCVTEPNDILEEFPQFKKLKSQKKEAVQLDFNENLILNSIGEEEVHFDEIAQKTQIDTKTLSSLLTRMEIRGLIIRLAGNFFTAKR